MQEYISVRQEVLLHVQLYKTQERNGTILIALAGFLIPLLIGQNIPLPGTGITVRSTPGTDLIILFAISTITFYMLFSALAILFALQVLAERCVRLEKEINHCLGATYLVWERLAKLIWSNTSVLIYRMPDTLTGLISALLVSILAFLLPLYGVTRILCGGPEAFLVIILFFYGWYLFAIPILGYNIAVYAAGDLRRDCEMIFRHELQGNGAPLTQSGKTTFWAVTIAAAVCSLIFVKVAPQPAVCGYLGVKSSTSAAAPVTVPSSATK